MEHRSTGKSRASPSYSAPASPQSGTTTAPASPQQSGRTTELLQPLLFSINLMFRPALTCEQELKILEPLYMWKQLTPYLKWVIHLFPAENHGLWRCWQISPGKVSKFPCWLSLDQPILPQISQLMVCNSDRQQEPYSNSSNSTIEILNKAHSDSMYPASLRIKE